jgi:hypothetical protein
MFLSTLLFMASAAHADVNLSCTYMFYGTPTASVAVSIDDNGVPGSSAMISMGPGTQPHKESLTPEALGDNEYMHAWLSKESAENSVEMIVYKEKQAQGNSVLINHHVPLAQEMWGDCTGM